MIETFFPSKDMPLVLSSEVKRHGFVRLEFLGRGVKCF